MSGPTAPRADRAWGIGAEALAIFAATDPEGRHIVWASPALASLVGLSVDALVTHPGALRALVFAEDALLLQVTLDRAAEQQRPYQCDYRITRPDGVELSVRECGVVGESGVRASLVDRDEVVSADQAAVGSDGWYRTLFENATDAMLVLEKGHVIECNSAAVQLFGIPRGVLLGKSPSQFSPAVQPDGRDTREREIELVAAAQSGRPQRFEWEHRRADGAPVFVEVTLRRAREAGPEVLVAVVRDISDRRAFEVAMRASERRFRSVFEWAPFGASIVDEAGRYVDVNASFVQKFGLERAAVLGKNAVELGLLTERDIAHITRIAAEHGQIRDTEIEMDTAAGPRTIAVSASLVQLDEGPHWLSTFVDITALRTAQQELERVNEQLERRVHERTAELERAISERGKAMSQLVHAERLASLGSVVAGVAHELNTPLGNAVTVGTSFVAKIEEFRQRFEAGGLRKSELAQFVDTATDAALLLGKNLVRAHELITSFKQVAIDQTSVRRRRFDLRDTVLEVLSTLQHVVKPFEVVVDIAPGIVLDSYPGPLQQVLTNLVNNSATHGFEGRSEGRIEFHAELELGFVRLRYEDNGRGMTTAVARRAFEPFFTTRLGQGGSGLGLYLVYNLVTAVLGGTIALHGSLGGVSFEIALPTVAPEPDSTGEVSEFPSVM